MSETCTRCDGPIVQGSALCRACLDTELKQKRAFQVGDFVRFADPNGSTGKIIGTHSAVPHSAVPDDYYVEWHFGLDAHGGPITAKSGSLRARELVPITEAEYRFVADNRAFPKDRERERKDREEREAATPAAVLTTITTLERLRCMDEDDRRCDCGARVSVRWCERANRGNVVSCPTCGRSYEVVWTNQEPTSSLPDFSKLPRQARNQ